MMLFIRRLKSVLLGSSFILLFSATPMFAENNAQENYAELWKKIEALMKKSKPKSALNLVDEIYHDAVKSNNYCQILKTIIYRINIIGTFEENYYDKAVDIINAEIERSDNVVLTSVLNSLLAELYRQYLNMNRWRILNRTTIVDYKEKDYKLWDLKTFVSNIAKLYLASIEKYDILKNTALEKFDEILIEEEKSKVYRPTMFDLLAYRALDFFTESDGVINAIADDFLIDNPNYIADNETFINSLPNLDNHLAINYQALLIYKKLTKLHIKSHDPRALIEVTLNRLNFVKMNDHGIDNVNDLFLAQLENLSEKYFDNDHYTLIRYYIALHFKNEGDMYSRKDTADMRQWYLSKARTICLNAIDLKPDGEGVNNCKNIIAQIERPSLTIETTEVSPVGEPLLYLTKFRNLDDIHYRIVKINKEDYSEMLFLEREKLLEWHASKKPIHSWSVSTDAPMDYRMHSFEYGTPPLEKGHYLLIASGKQNFSAVDNQISVSIFQVSDLAFIKRDLKNGDINIIVTDRNDGSPLNNVRVEVFHREWDFRNRVYVKKMYDTFITDRNGSVVIKPKKDDRSPIGLRIISRNDDTLISKNLFFRRHPYVQHEIETVSAYFFLDRKIYRPGQQIFFKGIVVSKKGNRAEAVADYNTQVRLLDVNRQQVAVLNLTTNKFGSFNGSFTLPSTGLTGMMEISSELGSVGFLMEEYKRPNFSVTLNPVTGEYKLGDTLTVEGFARAYAGFNLTGSKVSWRITREVRYPYGGFRGHPWLDSPEKNIFADETIIDDDGMFKIVFQALPDINVDEKKNPVFYFNIYVDVTDINGETQNTSTVVAVGYRSLLLNAEIPEKVSKVEDLNFPVKIVNLNDVQLNVPSKWRLYKLEDHERLYRDRRWEAPSLFVMDEDLFVRMFPHDLYHAKPEEPERSLMSAGTLRPEESKFLDLSILKELETGNYILELEVEDHFNNVIVESKSFMLFDPKDRRTATPLFFFFEPLQVTAEPGEKVSLIIGSSERVEVRYTLELEGEIIEDKWIRLNRRQNRITVDILEEYRGGVTVHFAMIQKNREYLVSRNINIPYTNKKLNISFASFRDKLLPGEEEEYYIVIKDHKDDPVSAEFLAAMYDASLDAFMTNEWHFSPFHPNRSLFKWGSDGFSVFPGSTYGRFPFKRHSSRNQQYDRLIWFPGYGYGHGYGYPSRSKYSMELESEHFELADDLAVEELDETIEKKEFRDYDPDISITDTHAIKPRSDFSETAFFYPVMETDEDGVVKFKYRIPEALTAWKMLGLAHTPDLKSGTVEKMLVTQKELMVIPNAPRFFRENDQIKFSAKVQNLSEKEQNTKVTLSLKNAITGEYIDQLCQNIEPHKEVKVMPGGSASVLWSLVVPEGVGAITYTVTAASENYSDGEKMSIPVLSNRTLVTESLPLPVRGQDKKYFKMDKLIKSESSSTLRHHKLTLEFTSNPAWYAVQALPYLMEFPYNCSEQIFSRYYANTIASHIVNSNPNIRMVFDNWEKMSPSTFLSNLEKNSDLKALLLEETPWVRESISESEQKKRIALLFDLNRMADETNRALYQLMELQKPNGGWAWFDGGRDDRYVTQHILTGLARLYNMELLPSAENKDQNNLVQDMIHKAINYADKKTLEYYKGVKHQCKDKPEDLLKVRPGRLEIQYLYARSLMIDVYPFDGEIVEAVDFLLEQTKKYWNEYDLMMQGFLALSLNVFDNKEAAQLIMSSINERSLYDKEMGMYWRTTHGWRWHQAPIEQQAILIEAFAEVEADFESVIKMQTWLLKQKQTQHWQTTKATVEACYALLFKGHDFLEEEVIADIKVGGKKVDPYMDGAKTPEAGTGYFKVSWRGSDIKPEMGNVEVSGSSEIVSWGALYWQYFEQLDKITTHSTPLSINKQLFVSENRPDGVVMKPVSNGSNIKVGDHIVVRIELRVDRDMDYVHMKDLRASAFEPLTTISGYRWQQGLGYYESPRDASMNFFFDFLPRGTYLFEYSLYATHAGDFSNGITTVQCMYAPEFTAHSKGIRVIVE